MAGQPCAPPDAGANGQPANGKRANGNPHVHGCKHDAVQHETWVAGELDRIRARGQQRALRTFDATGPAGTLDHATDGVVAGLPVVSFASNDYLGLSNHLALRGAACDAVERWGTGSTSSRLVVGSRPCHDELESELCAWKRTDAALVFSSGYTANLGVLSTLGGPDCLIVSDELNHASIIDGCRLSRSPVEISRHNDVEHVEQILRSATTTRAMVVVDAVFSMDGDEAPVYLLGEVCARNGALLVIDEAHAVLGPTAEALADIAGLEWVHVVTMSKALGSSGGAACGPRWLIELLVNRARPFIFSTAPSPADTAAATAAVRLIRTPEGQQLITRLASLVGRVAPGHPSPIIPILIGSETDAVAASAELLGRGLLIPAIRPPTVAPGTSRLRIALSAAHTDAMIDDLLDGLSNLELVA
jgi:8-amino-7-oxononanoate synthase